MGFFSSMSSINKIYKILAPLEMNVIDYVGKARSSNFIRNNGSYFVVKEQEGERMIECREGEKLVKSDCISRARVRTRIPTAMLFFCCHKCHTRGKIGC